MPIIAAQSSRWHFADVPKIVFVGAVKADLTVGKAKGAMIQLNACLSHFDKCTACAETS